MSNGLNNSNVMNFNTRFKLMNNMGLTGPEFDFFYFIYSAQNEEDCYEDFSQWARLHKELIPGCITGLQEKHFINKSWKPDTDGFDPTTVDLNKTKVKQFFKNSHELGQEFWKAYPKNKEAFGKLYDLKDISHRYKSLDDFYYAYAKAINNDIETHNHIIALINTASANGLLTMKIVDFVIAQRWVDLEEIIKADKTDLANEMGSELFANYPEYLHINNQYVIANAISRYYKNREHFYFEYAQSIGFDMNAHMKVLEILEQAKDQELINFGLLEFVGNRRWEILEKTMNSGEINNRNLSNGNWSI